MHCCLDGYKEQGQAWNAPDPRKVTARYLYICRTTQLLCQGAITVGKMRPEVARIEPGTLIADSANHKTTIMMHLFWMLNSNLAGSRAMQFNCLCSISLVRFNQMFSLHLKPGQSTDSLKRWESSQISKSEKTYLDEMFTHLLKLNFLQ